MVRPTVAIVGAGASGALTALHLLSEPDGPRLFLIERREGFGPGTAYSTGNPEHLLNVRAGNMSAFPDRPGHFLAWMAEKGPGPVGPGDFVPRGVYGAYLQSLLREAATTASAVGRLMLVNDEAVGVEPGSRPRLRLGMGRDFRIDALVIATGNPRPEAPTVSDSGLYASDLYVADPWRAGALERFRPDDPVLLLGTGLTMVDVVLSLEKQGHHGTRIALSRRGLLPHRHAPPPPIPPGPLPPLPARLSEALHLVRRLARGPKDAFGRGGDWRSVIDALRPVTTGFWQAMDLETKRRFLRHLRPWWDIHRHRLAPQVADRILSLCDRGKLRVVAGRLRSFVLETDGSGRTVAAYWQPRGGDGLHCARVARVINCTGPGGDLSHSGPPIIRDLLDQGLARADPLTLGLDIDADGRLVGADGVAGRFYAVGPPTRGAFWETTAIPDIRVQAARVARTIIRDLG
ncbi:FAD/NAD(P)-binding protein [Rhodospirillum centenum]|uniref:FAD-dependent urate hydroxylase HpyO/Asp monooxygenase CreE-like FAD/NAD(P)-binding domain-containing protein n=1 Tax=Rhodospirillum centenum (strain ATCC 51521 / SW) TaxID=414684 RepID=B6IYL7_RHOCS|nr:FAD/NAD(P)-binding protein [Rhodospirillum centenum]ACJ01391.1 conserved hypothetical protein [Rhodospirillum centenum SW]